MEHNYSAPSSLAEGKSFAVFALETNIVGLQLFFNTADTQSRINEPQA